MWPSKRRTTDRADAMIGGQSLAELLGIKAFGKLDRVHEVAEQTRQLPPFRLRGRHTRRARHCRLRQCEAATHTQDKTSHSPDSRRHTSSSASFPRPAPRQIAINAPRSTFNTDRKREQRAQPERFGGLEQRVVKPGPRVVGHIETNREVDETTGRNSDSAGQEPKAARVDAAIRFGDQIAPHEAHLERESGRRSAGRCEFRLRRRAGRCARARSTGNGSIVWLRPLCSSLVWPGGWS